MAANPLLMEYFVNAVSGDYENFTFLRTQIMQLASEYQQPFSDERLLAAIAEAVKDDLVGAYKFNPKIHFFEKCNLEIDSIDDYWFLKKGALGYPHNL